MVTDRRLRWFGAGLVAAGVGAALLMGPSAFAETGSSDGQGAGSASTSTSTSGSTSTSTSSASNSAEADAASPSSKPSDAGSEASSSTSAQQSTAESPTRVSALQITTDKTPKTDNTTPDTTSPPTAQPAASNPAFSLTTEPDTPPTEAARPETTNTETTTAPHRNTSNRTSFTAQATSPETGTSEPAKSEPARVVDTEKPVGINDNGAVASTALASRALPQEEATTATAFDVAPATAEVAVAQPTQLTALAEPPKFPLLNLIGTVVINVLSWAVALFTPPPVVPPGSSVTIGRAQLAVPCDCQAVDARWYFPNQEQAPTGVTYLQHGFFRNNANVSALAVQIAEQTNTVVVAPTISSNFFAADGCWINGDPMHQAVAKLFTDPDRTALQASATAAAIDAGVLSPGQTFDLPDQFVLSGHSAGGNLVAATAGYIAADTESTSINNLRAVVMFDGVDNNGAIGRGVRLLPADVPVYQISSGCNLCNGFGSGTTALENARPGEFVGVLLKHGTHIDAEGASSGFPAKLVCGFPRSANVAAVQDIASGWIIDALHPDDPPVGVYGPQGSTIEVPTDAGTATAVVLGHAPAEAAHPAFQTSDAA